MAKRKTKRTWKSRKAAEPVNEQPSFAPVVKSTDTDEINHPPHYTSHPSGVECIDVIEHFPANIANAVKYLWRAGLKHPDPLTDLRKAEWYVKREIERISKMHPADRRKAMVFFFGEDSK